jgi:hypothetical protein
VRPGLTGGDERHLLAAVEAPRLDAGDHLGRLHLERRRDLHRQVVLVDEVEVLVDAAHTRAAGENRLPGGGDVTAERGGRPHPGDDDLDAGIGSGGAHWFFAM